MQQSFDFLIISQNSHVEELFVQMNEQQVALIKMADSFDAALQCIDSQRFKFIFVDLEDSDLRSLQILEWLNTRHIFSIVGVIFKKNDERDFLNALLLNVSEFINFKNINADILKKKMIRLLSVYQAKENFAVAKFSNLKSSDSVWVARESQTKQAVWLACEWAKLSLSVLISGGVGAGKSHLAKIASFEKEHLCFDFNKVTQAEQKNELISQLKKINGDQQESLFCLVLENVEFMSKEVQEFLFAYLKTGCFEEFEFSRQIQLVATTAKNLKFLAEQNLFRKDLFLLMNQNLIKLENLSLRPLDLLALIEYFLKQLGKDRFYYFSKDAMSALLNYDWPENVSELKMVIESILKQAKDSMIPSKLLPAKILQKSFYKMGADHESLADFSYNEAKKRVLNQFNHDYIFELLKKSDGNLTVAAERAGVDRSNFKKIIKKYGLEK